jgi:hypothetical protein
MYRKLIAFVIATGFALLAGCTSVGVPEDKKDYIGEWVGVGMNLTITSDGGVDYRRVSGSGSKTITAPIKAWHGDDFEVGISLISTIFVVSKTPYKDGNIWRMVVDGAELERVR